MAYQPNIPLATDQLNVSQADINGNFLAISAFINVNHVDFASADQGKHKFITFPVQLAAPAFAPTEVGLFARLSTLTNNSELWVDLDNGPTIAFTAAQNASPGWCYLPSGLILKWGDLVANGLTAFLFPVAATIPAFTNIFSMQVTTSYISVPDGDGFVRLNDFAPLGFSAYGSQRTTVADQAVAFQYFAIGN